MGVAGTGGGVGTKGVPRADREQQILDAAVAEFGERGYAHASMAAIAQRAGISKPLVYEYFGSKDGLYLACLSRAGAHLVGRVAAAQSGMTLRRAGDTLAAIFSALDGRRLDWAVIFDPTLPAGSARRRAAGDARHDRGNRRGEIQHPYAPSTLKTDIDAARMRAHRMGQQPPLPEFPGNGGYVCYRRRGPGQVITVPAGSRRVTVISCPDRKMPIVTAATSRTGS